MKRARYRQSEMMFKQTSKALNSDKPQANQTYIVVTNMSRPRDKSMLLNRQANIFKSQ